MKYTLLFFFGLMLHSWFNELLTTAKKVVATNNKKRKPVACMIEPSGSHCTLLTVLLTSMIVFLSIERLSCWRRPSLIDHGLPKMLNSSTRIIRIGGKAKTAKKEAAAAIC